jgi:hypothetical protein
MRLLPTRALDVASVVVLIFIVLLAMAVVWAILFDSDSSPPEAREIPTGIAAPPQTAPKQSDNKPYRSLRQRSIE